MMKKLLNMLGGCLVIGVIGAGVWLLDHATSPQTKLNKFHFSSSEDEMAKQLGVDPADDMQRHFTDTQYNMYTVNEFDVRRTRKHGVDKWAFNLDCWSSRVGTGAMRSRAKALWHGPASPYSTVSFHTPGGTLEIDPDRCSVSGDDLASPEVANAFLPIALYAIYGSPMPTAAQIAMINQAMNDGPTSGPSHAAREH